MLSVRGEGILSWIGNNNFVVEDKTAAAHEVVYTCFLLFVLVLLATLHPDLVF